MRLGELIVILMWFFCSLTDLSRPNLREISRFAYTDTCEISPVSILYSTCLVYNS